MEKEIIKTNQNNEKRGTYYLRTRTFRRDNTPIFKGNIFLETDVVSQLVAKGCEKLLLYLRDGRKKEIPLKEFMDNSSIQQMGYKDDVRTQYVYYVSTKEIEERKAEEEQRKEEQDKRQFKLFE
tara:strand:+ start:234 stop:605 length:372 start_codon:yes stop_codon:yes gene_type:complete